MLKHLVLWKLKAENKAQNLIQFKSMLEALPALIPGALEFEVGANNLSVGTQSADISLLSAFADEESLQAYANHPEHLKVIAFAKDVVSERVVMDYLV